MRNKLETIYIKYTRIYKKVIYYYKKTIKEEVEIINLLY